ncbi:DNA-methyltransferase [Burkholderia seminalis]|uniref:DNA-methyltransferase n=1 Tax=Burkholderia seminalis TaxID=488731 RepID=UPI0026512958|nr:site-specific DNA-methyltransferase [Burkholderia seminalis]MDN7587263.1 site-specific DNA-methyltransferase [Burkholderia seminalis]
MTHYFYVGALTSNMSTRKNATQRMLIEPEEISNVHPSGRVITEWRGPQAPEWRLINGPAKESLDLIPDGTIDCTVTSPPYFWLRDYKVDGQIGLEDSVEAYVVAIKEVMEKVRKKLKPEGVLFLNLGDTYYSGKGEPHGDDKKSSKRRFGLRAVDKSGGLGIGLQKKSTIGIPWRVALAMCLDNWVLRSPIIWHRENCLPEPTARDRPSRSYEFVFMFVKSRKYFFNKENLPHDSWAEDVWNIPSRPKVRGSLDTAPYPDELVERCLTIGCPPGGTVLDPFCGSGTTLRVARKLGHPAIGIDLNPDFCSYIKKHI